ncbi:MAG TPA: hypothetical protein VFQ98_02635 [Gallionella sp.]|nr:hypothetical protein [Gallionella sp.]
MSQNLTQPEEVDHILMAMAVHDMEAETPIPDGAQSSGAVRDTERDELSMAAGFPCGVVHKK